MPGTFAQLLEVFNRPVLDQSCKNGRLCGTVSAQAGDAGLVVAGVALLMVGLFVPFAFFIGGLFNIALRTLWMPA